MKAPWWLVPSALILGTMLNVGCRPEVQSTPGNPLMWADDSVTGVRCYGWTRTGISCVKVAP